MPNYGKVKYEGVYPGVDVVYYGTLRQLEYDFNVAPGADAGRIRMQVEGAEGISIDANGDLVLPTAAGEIRQRAPHAYQEVEGVKQTISCRYVLCGAGRVGFELGAYDQTKPLVIDPVIGHSTYLGGGGYDEGAAVAVDAQGNAYVTGFATSWDFPVTPGVYQSSNNADGGSLHYATYFGGYTQDRACAVALDAEGNAYVAGDTESYGLPTTPGAPGPSHAGGFYDGFLFKLNSTGTAVPFATNLDGSDWDSARGVAVGADSSVYLTGVTSSPGFHTTPGAFQPQDPDQGLTDGFVMRLVFEAGPYTVSGRVTNS